MNRVERRCASCGTWNVENEEECKSCGALISPQAIRLQEAEKRVKLQLSLPPTFLDKLFSHWRNSNNPLVKFTYYAAYSVWMFYATILAFFLWIIAATPG